MFGIEPAALQYVFENAAQLWSLRHEVVDGAVMLL
jgi:hypothetical protein